MISVVLTMFLNVNAHATTTLTARERVCASMMSYDSEYGRLPKNYREDWRTQDLLKLNVPHDRPIALVGIAPKARRKLMKRLFGKLEAAGVPYVRIGQHKVRSNIKVLKKLPKRLDDLTGALAILWSLTPDTVVWLDTPVESESDATTVMTIADHLRKENPGGLIFWPAALDNVHLLDTPITFAERILRYPLPVEEIEAQVTTADPPPAEAEGKFAPAALTE